MTISLLCHLLNTLNETIDDVFFVQIGAMDGIGFDPVRPSIVRYGWRGILVEPLKDHFVRLAHNYSNSNNLILENVAITEKMETRMIKRVPLDVIRREGLPDWVQGISSFYSDRNTIGGKRLSTENYERLRPLIVEEEVDCIPLEILLSRNNVKKIDLLQIDTEGYDYNILKQLDFSIYKPYLINMEYIHLPDEEQRECTSLLKRHGYELAQSDIRDIVAMRKDWYVDHVMQGPGLR